MNLFDWTFGLFGDLGSLADTVGFVFAVGNLFVATFFRIAFRGRLRLTLIHRANPEATKQEF